jgi:hypothetical protein
MTFLWKFCQMSLAREASEKGRSTLKRVKLKERKKVVGGGLRQKEWTR